MKATMSRTDSPLLHLHPNDNVLVAKTALALGQEISELGVRTRAQVPAGHKIAARRIAAGEQVKKYDTVIGVATRDLEPGDYVHSHNLQLVDYYRDPAFGADVQPVDYVPEAERATFQGFVRPGGGVGTRNFIGILSSVNCSATVIKRIAAHFTPERLAAYPHVDGVAAFAQTSGCGMSSPSEHFDVLRRTLECGGSDGFSGITANPGLGAAMDILVRHGGTAILSETPEIHGVEFMLTRRAITPEVGQKLLDRLAWWEKYTAGQNAQFNGVVGHGNQAGGLANIFEKSLGSAMKGGTTPLRAVYEYAEPITENGFVFMDSPGYDPVASTGQIASGAQLICFTTGRGSMFGSKPAPTIKLASNTPMFTRLEEDMDINCGVVIDGECTVAELGQRIFEQILRHASGEQTKSELLGLGDHEFVPWHMGIVS